MASPVKLYVYDLSNGLAKQLSLQFTGKQIDGIWHTSVVVFEREVFYGQGVYITHPGKSPYGTPLQVIDMGETALDLETFNDYLAEIRGHYTADKYHLLDFNCNSFTNDCVGFLTGGSIPHYIRDLPADFLSSPFGAALRPTIDSMYRRPVQDAISTSSRTVAEIPPNTQHTASTLQVTSSRTAPAAPASAPASTQTGRIHVCTNPSSFNLLLTTHSAVVAFFTSAGCPPCRMVAPVFETLASEKGGRDGVAFTKIDLGVGLGGSVAQEWGVRVTPTFLFFLNGKKLHEMKGANIPELQTQVDLLLYQAYPPHPHTSISIPTVESLSLNPILFSQVPALDTVLNKLVSFIDTTPSWPPSPSQTQEQVKDTLIKTIVPYLKVRFPAKTSIQTSPPFTATPAILHSWAGMTTTLVDVLPVSSLFPLVDMWRLALLDHATGTFLSTTATNLDTPDPLSIFLAKGVTTLSEPTPSRNYILTLLRFMSNSFSYPPLASRVIEESKTDLTALLVTTLLHEDASVRTAAASLAFNVAAWLQKGRVELVRNGLGGEAAKEDGGDWEVEMISAVVEAIGREKESEDVVHRLTASLAFLIRLSPFYETLLVPLLEVLQGRSVLQSKLGKGGCGQSGVGKKEVRKLVEEVAYKLCP